jgi:hypothetical protein
MKSNCGKWAWEEYVADPGRWYFAFTISRHVGFDVRVKWIQRIALFAFYLLFHLLVYLHLIGTGKGMHFILIPSDQVPLGSKEFVPVKAKRKRSWPPLWFEGKVKTHE